MFRVPTDCNADPDPTFFPIADPDPGLFREYNSNFFIKFFKLIFFSLTLIPVILRT